MSIDNFYKVCNKIKLEWKSPTQINEEHFVYVLNFIKGNVPYRSEVLSYFLSIMKGEIDMPPELIEFCMRELQWPEIKNFAIKQIESGDPRTLRFMEHILEVYQSEWEDADLYKYYSK